MKVSAIVLSALISFTAMAQTPTPKEEKPKTKSTAIKVKKNKMAKQDSIKASTKNNKKQISPDYCPPCGMG